jgi:uncharacterized protein YabN with tetrapyrrole methylase and pyrophosphatase domain
MNNGNGSADKRGSLTVVGTGIRTVGQLTLEAVAWIRQADRVLYVVGDPIAESMIHELNPKGAESLTPMYAVGKPRIETYTEMVGRMIECVKAGETVVAACYGHPGVFVYPTHEAIRRLRAEGYSAKMLPGVSAEDCLFADLGVDPGMQGCQSFEATDWLLNGRVADTSSGLVLWQIGVLGDSTFKQGAYNTSAMPLLVEKLLGYYPPTHPVYLYEAAVLPNCEPTIATVAIAALPMTPMSAGYTAYVPPARPTSSDPMLVARMNALQQGAAAMQPAMQAGAAIG